MQFAPNPTLSYFEAFFVASLVSLTLSSCALFWCIEFCCIDLQYRKLVNSDAKNMLHFTQTLCTVGWTYCQVFKKTESSLNFAKCKPCLKNVYLRYPSLSTDIYVIRRLSVNFKTLVNLHTHICYFTLRDKCPNAEFFLVFLFRYSTWVCENTDQRKLRIWTLFTQCHCVIFLFRVLRYFCSLCSCNKFFKKKVYLYKIVSRPYVCLTLF